MPDKDTYARQKSTKFAPKFFKRKEIRGTPNPQIPQPSDPVREQKEGRQLVARIMPPRFEGIPKINLGGSMGSRLTVPRQLSYGGITGKAVEERKKEKELQQAKDRSEKK